MIKRCPTVLSLSRARRRGLLRHKSRDNLFGSKSLRHQAAEASPGFLIVARTLSDDHHDVIARTTASNI